MQKIASEVFDPFDIDLGRGAREESTGLHPLTTDDPLGSACFGGLRLCLFGVGSFALFFSRLVIEKSGAREEEGLAVSGAAVIVLFFFVRDVAKEAGEDGAMDGDVALKR